MSVISLLLAVAIVLEGSTPVAGWVPQQQQQQHVSTRRSSFAPTNHLHRISSAAAAFDYYGITVAYARRGAGKDDDGDDDEPMQPGMAEAFRQLEQVSKLNDDDIKSRASSVSSSPTSSSSTSTAPSESISMFLSSELENIPPEKEIQLYKDMVKDLEDQDEEDLYSGVLADMGGTASSAAAARSSSSSPPPSILSSTNDVDDEDQREEFMNQALAEALKDVKLNNPKVSKSILDDKEIMKEIEAIFEKGNEKLMESLEEIRQEQRVLAQASAEKTAKAAQDDMNQDAQRLVQAEASMSALLQKVNKETVSVQQAVRDLEAAKAELDGGSNNFLLKVKQGGIVKQLSLIGMILFAFRSMVDTVSAVTTSTAGGDSLTVALIQGGVALVCAAIFFLV